MGSALNQDGRAASLTAPSGRAQCAALAASLADAGLAAAAVGFVEAHGTGTQLGDPIEMGALLKAYGDRAGASLVVGALDKTAGRVAGYRTDGLGLGSYFSVAQECALPSPVPRPLGRTRQALTQPPGITE